MGPEILAQADPARLTTVDWKTTSEMLHFLWYNLITVILFASLLLFAHAVLPSAIASGHVPAGLRATLTKIRFSMYAAAVLLLFLVAFWFSQAVHHGYDLGRIYPRWWM